ncbi:MAG: cytochrome P450 [Actinomycetota bacterium]|nr:cytochrome P450 [Actinomycetota bacterium]
MTDTAATTEDGAAAHTEDGAAAHTEDDVAGRVDAALAEIFLTPEGHADPYARYALIHELAPVHESSNGDVFLARYDDCRALLRDNRFGKAFDPDRGVPNNADAEAIAYRRARSEQTRDAPRSMLALNPPDHTRIRSLVSRAFTPRRVERLRGRIEALAEERFDEMAERRELDLLEVCAFPLPVAVIGELVGVPRADWGRFRSLMSAAVMSLETGATRDELEAAEQAGREVWRYFTDLVAHKRREPGDDLISAMLEVEDGGDTLSEGELIASANLMFAAGFETTTNLIGNGVVALLRHPDQLARLRAEPDLASSAVEEMLRYDSPVQLDSRTAFETTDVAGVEVPKGRRVVTLLGAANHDPTHWSDPGRFDITRAEGPPMSFASGIHYCLGANLARLEGEVVVSGMLRRFAGIELTAEPVNRPRLTLRGYESVPLRIVPA